MRPAYKWQVAIISAIGLFMAVLDNTVVNVALPQMQASFHTDRTTIIWVVTAYFLAQAAVIPITGYLSDRIGSKTVFLGALAIFTLGSALCAFAPSERLLIIFRVFQGIGGGALFPVAFAQVFRVFPPAERGPASAAISVPVLLAPAFGPTIGGYLTTNFNWNSIFTVNIPVGIVAFILGFIVLRGRAADEAAQSGTQPIPARVRFDIVGLLLSMAGFTSLVYGISEAGTKGWNDQGVDLFMGVGAALVIIFIINELRVSDPVLDVRLFKNYTFTSASLLTWGVSAFLFGSLILLPYFFENIRGLSALSTGEVVISQGLAAAVTTIIAGRFYNRVGPRVLVCIGFLLITAGTYGMTHFDVNSNGDSIQLALILRGMGLGLTNIPLQTLAISVVSNRAMARASSLINVTRQVAGAVGIAILTSFLAQQTKSHVASATTAFQSGPLATAKAKCATQFGGDAQAIGGCVQQFAQQHAQLYVGGHAFVLGLNDTFMLATIATGVCVAIALVLGRDPNLVAMRRAAARGEAPPTAAQQPVLVGE